MEEIIEKCGFGRFQYKLMIVCGLVFMADAMEIMLLSFLQIVLKSEWALSSNEQASITSVVFLGELPGSIFWGYLADTIGRKKAFFFSALTVAIFGVLSAMANSLGGLLFCRALVGFGVSGSLIPFDLISEFLPQKGRGKKMMILQLSWPVGSILVAVIAWGVLEKYGWQVMILLCSLPLIVALFCIPSMPESPKWLAEKGDTKAAIKIVQMVATMNQVDEFPKLNLRRMQKAHRQEMKNRKNTSLFSGLLNASLRRTTICLWTIWLGFGFCYYGIVLYFPRMFSKIQKDNTMTFDYQPIFLSAVAEFLGSFLTILVIDRFGRRKTQYGFYAACALFLFILSNNISLDVNTFTSILARACIVGGSATTWIATPGTYNVALYFVSRYG